MYNQYYEPFHHASDCIATRIRLHCHTHQTALPHAIGFIASIT